MVVVGELLGYELAAVFRAVNLDDRRIGLVGKDRLRDTRDDDGVHGTAEHRGHEEEQPCARPRLRLLHMISLPFFVCDRRPAASHVLRLRFAARRMAHAAYATPSAVKPMSSSLMATNGNTMPPRPYTSRLRASRLCEVASRYFTPRSASGMRATMTTAL